METIVMINKYLPSVKSKTSLVLFTIIQENYIIDGVRSSKLITLKNPLRPNIFSDFTSEWHDKYHGGFEERKEEEDSSGALLLKIRGARSFDLALFFTR